MCYVCKCYKVAGVLVPVPKLQDLKSQLHHMRLTIIAQYKGLNLDPQAMLAIYSVLSVMDSRLVGSGFRF